MTEAFQPVPHKVSPDRSRRLSLVFQSMSLLLKYPGWKDGQASGQIPLLWGFLLFDHFKTMGYFNRLGQHDRSRTIFLGG